MATAEFSAEYVRSLESALRWIADNYANQDLSHVDFRVEASHRAEAALSKATGGV